MQSASQWPHRALHADSRPTAPANGSEPGPKKPAGIGGRPGALKLLVVPWFLHIGIANLFLMELLSGGFFQVYWCYRNWRYLRDRDREPMTPFWRACLNVFWMHALFRRIRRDQQLGSTWPPAFPATLLATIWVALNIGGAVGSLWYREHGPIIANLTVHGACLCLVPVQAAINRANRRRSPRPRMSRWNLRSVVCLGLVLMLATTALP